MTALPIIIAAIIVIIGALALPKKNEEPQTTLGETTQQPTPQKDANLPSTPAPSPTPIPTPPTGGSGQAQKDANLPSAPSLNDFLYPNASVKESSSTSLNLESSDNSDAITDWYKEKIKAIGMNAKSFVVTKTNGNVLNKLVGSDGSTEIRVEISKKSGDSTTKIVVSIQTS